jgi:hypothetical protein
VVERAFDLHGEHVEFLVEFLRVLALIKRKAEIAAEERRKEAERRRLERERLERIEKARGGRLLDQAKSLREADEIRAYVSAVRGRYAALDDPLSEAGFQRWVGWALSLSTPVQNLTVPPGENLTDRRGDEPQFVAAS